jgi:hypothetical protein
MVNMAYALLPRTKEMPNQLENAAGRIGEIVHLDIYDEVECDARILMVRADQVLVEVLEVTRLFAYCTSISPGCKIWVEDWVF